MTPFGTPNHFTAALQSNSVPNRHARVCRYLLRSVFCMLAATLCPGCAGESDPEKTPSSAPPVMRADAADEPEVVLPSQLRRRLKANENAKFERLGNDIVEAKLFQSGIKSIEPLKGLPLRLLDLGMTEVDDLSAIEGMPLKSLILENTPVEDISAVKGMSLEVLHLQNTKVTDLSAIEGMPIRELNLLNVPVKDLNAVAELPLQTLWVPGSNVTDIAPLTGKPMVSLDIQRTAVTSIEALKGMSTLRRLNIADTLVKDISSLEGLKLERITLSPDTIKTGIEVLREMPTLTQILTSMEGPRQSAADFWKKYDAGVWAEKTEGEDTPVGDTFPTEKDEPAPAKPSGDTGRASESADADDSADRIDASNK